MTHFLRILDLIKHISPFVLSALCTLMVVLSFYKSKVQIDRLRQQVAEEIQRLEREEKDGRRIEIAKIGNDDRESSFLSRFWEYLGNLDPEKQQVAASGEDKQGNFK